MMLLRSIPLLLAGLFVLSAAAQDGAPAAAPQPVAAPAVDPAITNAPSLASTNAPVALDTNAPVAAVTNSVIPVEPTAEDLIVRSNLNAAIRSNARTNSIAGAGTNAGKASNGTNTVGRFDYTSFRIIEDRNIFDPTRRPMRTNFTRGSNAPVRRSQFFGLVGTISYEKGSFAFFDGSSSEFRKALKPEDTIAGYKVSEIGTDKVKLESAGKAVELRVGSQMRKEEAGEWTVSTRTDTLATTVPTADATGDGEKAEATTEPSTGSGVLDDAIQRLLKRRQEEENK